MERIGECIVYYSENAEPFALKPKIFRRVTDKASNIIKTQFKKSGKHSSKYFSKEAQIEYHIDWKSEPSCSCFGFLKKAICSHVIAYNHLFEMNWYGPKVQKAIMDAKNFVHKNKRGAKKKDVRYKDAEKALVKK